jgi:hypothetical protein
MDGQTAYGSQPGKRGSGKRPCRQGIHTAKAVNGKPGRTGDDSGAKTAETRNSGMARRRKDRGKQNRVCAGTSRAKAGAKRMGGAGDEPAGPPDAPVRRERNAPFREMRAGRVEGHSKRGVVRYDPDEAPPGRHLLKHLCEGGAATLFTRPQNDKTAAWQRCDGGLRIWQMIVIRQQQERGQWRLRGTAKRIRRPCQLCACKAIRQTMSSPDSAASNLTDILARIAAARKAALAPSASTTLVAVSKTFGPDRIRPVIAAGQRIFGENRVQEAQAKWLALKQEWPDIALHLIGPLQSNKTKEAVALFDAIHSVDRPKIAESLRCEIDRSGRAPLLFIQVNLGEETQKAGVTPADTPKFIDYCRETLSLPIIGLMCIPPVDEPPAPHFALLAKIARAQGLNDLSMGMSADFESAIRFGATHVRVGSAIFGDREHPQ